MLETIPESIHYDDAFLHIKWRDGRDCKLSLLDLRKECPCAQCMGGHGGEIGATTGHITEIKLNAWKKVGRYALQFIWSDNHDAGIYRLDLLRQQC